MSEFIEFGDPARFAVALRWTSDSEPRRRRPEVHGWSTGDLRITIGGVVLTRSTWATRHQDHVGWYLSPIVSWLATNWTLLLHEENFAWREPTGLPAAAACRKALRKWIDAEDEAGRGLYREVQDWYRSHGLRSAAEGGLYPDLFLRRLVDDVELSWTGTQPVFAPKDFRFEAEPAHALLPVEDVAGPLWQALRWFADHPPQKLDEDDRALWEVIVQKIDALNELSTGALQTPYIASPLAEFLRNNGSGVVANDLLESRRSTCAPVVAEFSAAVAMFGGVSPNLSPADSHALLSILSESVGSAGEELERLTNDRGASPLGVPHRDGYEFAENLLDDLNRPGDETWIDIRQMLRDLQIRTDAQRFGSRDIRGVALAGMGISPRIIVNEASSFNASEEGKRFTLAHELCHVLHDQSRARRVTHVSGPWVAQGFERRANAFAAYLLMPRPLLLRHLAKRSLVDPPTIRFMASELRVSEAALVEHLYNMDFIGDWQREELRPLFRRTTH